MDSDFDPDSLDEFEDDDYEYISFFKSVRQFMEPHLKEFLSSYYGERMGQLESGTYIDLENAIKEGFFWADNIPDLLYNNRSISDEAFDAALDTYIPTGETFSWPRPKYWFDGNFTYDEEDEDTFLEDSDPIDLTEDQRRAKQIIEHVDNMQEDAASFADFVKKGFDTLSPKMQQYLEKVGPIDLHYLTAEGFEKVQENIFFVISDLLETMYGIVESDLESKR